MPYITEAMKPARVAKGITLAEMAIRIGRAESTVANAERGDKPMKIEYIARIAREIEVPLDKLVRDTPRLTRTNQSGEPAKAENGSEPAAEAEESPAA